MRVRDLRAVPHTRYPLRTTLALHENFFRRRNFPTRRANARRTIRLRTTVGVFVIQSPQQIIEDARNFVPKVGIGLGIAQGFGVEQVFGVRSRTTTQLIGKGTDALTERAIVETGNGEDLAVDTGIGSAVDGDLGAAALFLEVAEVSEKVGRLGRDRGSEEKKSCGGSGTHIVVL